MPGAEERPDYLKARVSLWLLALFCLLVQPQADCAEPKYCRIYYATTRLNEGTPSRPEFGKRRNLSQAPVTTGDCLVKTPPGLEAERSGSSPQYWKDVVNRNHRIWQTAVVEKKRVNPESEFLDQLSVWPGPVVVYTHGYEIPFDEACRDLATLIYALEQKRGKGSKEEYLPVLFSWPSVDSKADYGADEASLDWSYCHFRAFMDKVVKARAGKQNLNLVGHSMGNRCFMRYADEHTSGSDPPVVSNMILSSPDVDWQEWTQSRKKLEKIANNTFILVSDKDKPLLLSQYLHGQPRLGRPLDPPRVTKQRAELATSNYWLKLAADAVDILADKGYSDAADVAQWLAANPSLDQEYSDRTKLVDVSEIMDENANHALAWPCISQLLIDPSRLQTRVIHKRPDRESLLQSNGKPEVLYRFHKVVPGPSGQPAAF